MLLLPIFSCSPQSESTDLNEKLKAHCIRECVLETSDSEICDTECKCASNKLSREFSKEEFTNLVQNIAETKVNNTDSVEKLQNAVDSCKASE